MVIGIGDVAVGAQPGAHGRAGPGALRGSRRATLCGLFGAAGALLLTPLVAFRRPPRTTAPADRAFDETYRDHRIRGVFDDGQWHVTVDGRPLHLMRRADGTWLSMIDHYCSYTTPLEAARAAVDELGPGRQLRNMGWTHTGGHHGVHA